MTNLHGRPDARGFALPLVFLVLLLIAVAFIGFGDTVVVSAQTTARRADAQRMFYACEGVVRLAQGLTREMSLDDPDLDFTDLSRALEPVRIVAAENGIDLSAPVRTPEETKIIDEGALAGLEVISSSGVFGAAAPTGGSGCNVNISQPLGKISPLQFFAFSVDGGEIENNTNGFPANPDFSWGRTQIVDFAPLRDALIETSVMDAPLRLPAPAEPEGAGGVFSRTFKSYLQPPFTNNPTRVAERASGRFAYQADIRIVDGEWYLRDPGDPTAWPGVPIWGDHPCLDHDAPEKTCAASFNNKTPTPLGHYNNIASPLRRLYSAYERYEGGIIVPQPRGVVSYGKLAASQPGLTSSAPHCPNPPAPSGLTAVSQCVDQAASVVLGAREAFADPVTNGAILPINIDVGLLGSALNTLVNDELGTKVCVPGGACRRPFNGMVYVTSTKGIAPTLSPGPLPYALCSDGAAGGDISTDRGTLPGQPLQPCATAVKYNAVRLHNATDLNAFAATGLTIASDLPVYVHGDWNVANRARSLVMGDRVTVSTSGLKDDGSGPSGGNVSFTGSILAGWASGTPSSRKFSDLVRTVESNVNVRITGSLVGGFTSASLGAGRAGARIFQWVHPATLTRPTVDAQPPGVPRVSIGLPPEVSPGFGGCGGG